MKRLRTLGALAAVLLLFAAGPAFAQSNQEINAGVQFSFAPPGARSMALGGAFIGLADDATAAYSNPAGLTALTKPEISFEGRYSKFKSLFTDRGSEPPRTPTGRGIDTLSGLVDNSVEDNVGSPGFASFVYPKGRVAIALFRHELANYKASVKTNGAYGRDNSRYYPAIGSLELKVADYGLSVGVKASDALSLGVGLSLFNLSLNSTTDRYDFSNSTQTATGGFYGPPDYGAGNKINTQTQAGSGTVFGISAGVLWKPTSKLQLGAVYRKGPDFDKVDLANRPGPRASFTAITATSGLKIPDAFGAGIVLRPTDQLTFAVDVLQVKHSQRLNYFKSVFTDPQLVKASDYKIDDGTEFHAGIEYVFTKMHRPLALRAGGWREPDSRIRYTGDPAFEQSGSVLFRAGKEQWHGAFGLGWVLGPNFQVDLAGDLSDRSKIGTVSAVVRF